MSEDALLERIEEQAIELESLRAQLAQAIETAEKLASLEGEAASLQDENDALRRAIAEDEEIIKNQAKPIREIAERLGKITEAAGRVDVEALENVRCNLDALTTATAETSEKMREIPSAIRAHWVITIACIVITAAGVWYSANCARNAERAALGAQEAATAAYWGIYTPPNERGETHSAIEWSASWQKWQNNTK